MPRPFDDFRVDKTPGDLGGNFTVVQIGSRDLRLYVVRGLYKLGGGPAEIEDERNVYAGDWKEAARKAQKKGLTKLKYVGPAEN